MFTLVDKQLPLSMCQHGMISKAFWKSSSFDDTFILYSEGLAVLYRVQVATILHWAIVATRKASSRLGVLLGFLPISLHNLFDTTGDGFKPRFMFSPLRAPHGVICNFRCGHLFRLQSFIFSSLVPLPSVFPLFIYYEQDHSAKCT